MSKKEPVKICSGIRFDPKLWEDLRKEAVARSIELGFKVTVTDVITIACKKLLGSL